MKRSAVWALLSVVLALAGTAAAETLVPVVFQLDWKPNVQFAGLLLASHRGWYRQAGLDVTIRPLDPDEKIVERVVGHTNWLGSCESGVLLGARAGGAPLKAVGTMFQGTPICLMSLKRRELTRPAQLKGMRLGVHADGNQAIDVVLRLAGLSRKDLTIGLMPYDATLLLKGEYDVVQGYSVDEAVELEMTGHSLNLIFLHDHGYAAYGQVYFTSEDFLKRDPATVRKFMEVSRRGWQNAAASPDEAAEIVVRHFLKGADVTHQRASLKAIIPLLTREGGPDSYGRMSRETWQAAVAAYNALPSAPRKLSVEEFVVFNLQAP